jgi:hypothetical protein
MAKCDIIPCPTLFDRKPDTIGTLSQPTISDIGTSFLIPVSRLNFEIPATIVALYVQRAANKANLTFALEVPTHFLQSQKTK